MRGKIFSTTDITNFGSEEATELACRVQKNF